MTSYQLFVYIIYSDVIHEYNVPHQSQVTIIIYVHPTHVYVLHTE